MFGVTGGLPQIHRIACIKCRHGAYSRSVDLRQRLDDGLVYAALYRGVLSNHLPMALIALERMGASADQLHAFQTHYAKRLEPQTTPRPPRSLADLDRLAEGIGGAAFHGLIRLAFALESGHEPEQQAALDAWHQSYLPLGRTRVPVLDVPVTVPPARSIHERMHWVAQQDAFQAACTDQGAVMDFSAVRDLAVRTYWATQGDFTALHLVTATHAFRIVHSHYPIPIEPFLAALSSAYLTLPKPSRPEEVPLTDAAWEELIPLALQSLDDHTIKLVYTCREEEQATGDIRYRSLAAHRLRWESTNGPSD